MKYKNILTHAVKDALQKAFPELQDIPQEVIERPKDQFHGDYATSIALKISKKVGDNPRAVAEKLLPYLELPEFETPTIAGPGFINFAVTEVELQAAMHVASRLGMAAPELPEVTQAPVLFEYSAPNIAKPLGVHHLLSTITGQALANIYDFAGYNVVRINYIGDWGTQFGKLIYAIKIWGDHEAISNDPIEELLKLYVKFHDEAETNPELVDRGREELQKLEAGDAENKKLFSEIVTLSLQELQKTYDRLGGISFDVVRGESPVVAQAKAFAQEQYAAGILKDGEKGAIIAEFPVEDLSTAVVVRSDGATVYLTRDLATLKERIEKWQPQAVNYVVDVAQSLHFKQVFALAKQTGILPPDSNIARHISFGRMQFKDQKMSTRKGNILRLEEVLTEAEERAQALIAERQVDLPPAQQKELAHIIGVGGVKYAILSQNRTTDIVFDWAKIMSLEGNSAAYLQYTYARANKLVAEAPKLEERNANYQLVAAEKALIRELIRWPEVITATIQENKPHFLAEYLFTTAQAFNSFYANVPVLKEANESAKAARIALCQNVSELLKVGLNLLAGIQAPEVM